MHISMIFFFISVGLYTVRFPSTTHFSAFSINLGVQIREGESASVTIRVIVFFSNFCIGNTKYQSKYRFHYWHFKKISGNFTISRI